MTRLKIYLLLPFSLPVSLLVSLLVFAVPLSAMAQAQGMSSEVHRIVESANDLMESGDEDRAITELNRVALRVNLNNYEKAVIQQMLGFAWYYKGEPANAREAFEAALGFDALPENVAEGVTVVLAQVCMETGDLDCASDNIDAVISAAETPNPEHLGLAAFINYELGHYEVAERHALTAINAVEQPLENWYQILLAVYRAQEAWGKAEDALREILVRFPDNGNYWQFLSYVLFSQEKMQEALATLMLAWRLELLDNDDLERIVGFHANLGIPEKAARLLDEWLDTATLESSAERVTMLGRLWLMARERERAIDTLTVAAPDNEDGDIDLLLGKLHYEDQGWEASMRHLERALDKGGLSENESAEAWLLLGISAYHSGRRDTATTALESASETSRYEDHARYWLNRIREEAGS